MEKRSFGKTEEKISILGLGGFHLLEISDNDAIKIINLYLDNDGNYVETAAEYGGGESERKVGLVMKNRRSDCFLATKCHVRDKKGAEKTINESLKRLNTDYVDLLIFHHVQSEDDLNKIFSPDGAAEAFFKAKIDGKIRFIGISGHGVPDVLIKALNNYEFDAVMTGFNFFDRFNYPDVEDVLIPLAKKKGVAIIGMKAFADGLLWEYPEESLRYSLSLPIDTMVAGFNTIEMLKKDLDIVNRFKPMTDEEKDRLYRENSVLGNYICRQCGLCVPCPEGIDIPRVFLYEGWYDRQLRDRVIRTAPDFALRDRLRFWFDNRDKAKEAYAKLEVKADACTKCGECMPKCPYNIDIISKLENAHYKLTREVSSSIPV